MTIRGDVVVSTRQHLVIQGWKYAADRSSPSLWKLYGLLTSKRKQAGQHRIRRKATHKIERKTNLFKLGSPTNDRKNTKKKHH